MGSLNDVVTRALADSGIDVVSFPPHSICRLSTEGDPKCFFDTVSKAVEVGLTPVLYGDVVISEGGDFQVLSGDTLMWLVAKYLGAREMIFVTDVDGVFTSDPKVDPKAKLIRSVRAEDLTRYSLSGVSGEARDVTGGMVAKLLLGLELGVRGVVVKVVGGMREGNLFNALTSHEYLGTTIWY